jgi:hypothetical protein
MKKRNIVIHEHPNREKGMGRMAISDNFSRKEDEHE